MPRFSRGRGRSRFGGNRPKRAAMEWIGAHTSETGVPGEMSLVALQPATGLNEWILTPGENIEFFDEPTLLRSLINVTVHTPAALNLAINTAGWIGMLVMAGDTTVPDPDIQVADASKDWIWWMPFILGTTGAGQALGIAQQGSWANSQFDVRSKRKIMNGNGIALYLGFAGAVSNSDVILGFQGRFLFKN